MDYKEVCLIMFLISMVTALFFYVMYRLHEIDHEKRRKQLHQKRTLYMEKLINDLKDK